MPAHRVDGPARVTGARRSGRRTRAALRAAQCKRLAPGSRVVVRCAPAITAATSMSFAQPAWRSSLGVSGMCSRRHRRCRCRNAMAARSPFAGALVRRVTADDGEGGGGSWAHRTDSAAGGVDYAPHRADNIREDPRERRARASRACHQSLVRGAHREHSAVAPELRPHRAAHGWTRAHEKEEKTMLCCIVRCLSLYRARAPPSACAGDLSSSPYSDHVMHRPQRLPCRGTLVPVIHLTQCIPRILRRGRRDTAFLHIEHGQDARRSV